VWVYVHASVIASKEARALEPHGFELRETGINIEISS
jgi:hypothetical protein